jgi:protein tyrosine phosphatase (PTP) superfamily phosphohydrolase (DUF442 family)
MTNATTTPQSCYQDEIETLREMLTDEQRTLAHCETRTRPTAMTGLNASNSRRRIEALRTAIEALGGAL